MNTHRQQSESAGLNPPADFSVYRTRQHLVAKRNAEQDQVKREQINLLLEQLQEYDRATGQHKLDLGARIASQMQLVAS